MVEKISPITTPKRPSRLEPWLKKRLPRAKCHTLGQRSIFIFPSRFGLLYLFVCLFLYILGSNYQNNLILLLSFILLGFFITSIMYSYANLSGLIITSSQPNPVYANETAMITLHLDDCANRNALTFCFRGHPDATLDLATQPDKIRVAYTPDGRGLLNPGRVMLRSYFPLGLLRCWTHLDLDIELLVYPTPINEHIPLLSKDDELATQQQHSPQLNEFIGIKDHVEGESISRISWKHVARNQQKLVSKQFSDHEQPALWLNLSQVRGDNLEHKLAKLAFAVDYYSQQQQPFGLALNDTVIPAASGAEQRLKCLEALALC